MLCLTFTCSYNTRLLIKRNIRNLKIQTPQSVWERWNVYLCDGGWLYQWRAYSKVRGKSIANV